MISRSAVLSERYVWQTVVRVIRRNLVANIPVDGFPV